MTTEYKTLATESAEVKANEDKHMCTRDFVYNVIPDFLQGYDDNGVKRDDAPDVALQTLIAVRENKEDAPESNGLPLMNVMIDVLVDDVPVGGKRVSMKAPTYVMAHIADSINEALAVYNAGVDPKAYKARKAITDRLGVPERVANLMTDEEVLEMTMKAIFK